MGVLKTLILIIIAFSIFSNYSDNRVSATLQVVLVEPPVNAEGVPINPIIIAFFPAPLLEETVIVENIKINNGEIPINVQIHPSLTAIQIIPLTPLSPATKYTVSLKEEISDIMGNKLTGGYDWSFIIAGPTIDKILVSDTRCDIGASVNISVHFNWGNGTDITSGTVFFKDTEVLIDQLGWTNYTLKNIKFGKNSFNITGIDCKGIKKYQQKVDAPDIIGDVVSINVKLIDDRMDVGKTASIDWSAKYDYDNTNFNGEVKFNELSLNQVSKQIIYVTSIIDTVYGLTKFKSANASLILDRVKIIEAGLSAAKAKPGESITFSCKAVYEFDNTVFDGLKGVINCNGEAMSWSIERQVWEKSFKLNEPGSLAVKVTGIRDDFHGLTIFNDVVGSKTASWEISFLEAYWPIFLILGGLSIIIIIIILNILRKRKKKEGDFCKEHPEIVEAEQKACWDAQLELDTAVSNIRDSYNRAMPRWRDNLRVVGRLLLDWDLKIALISHWTGAEKEIYESAEKVQKVAGIVTSAAGKAKTAFKEGGEAALKELGTDVAKEIGGDILGEISSTLGQVLELEDWAIREIGVGLAQGLTGINPRRKASNIRKSSEITCTDLMSWIDHSYAWNSGRRPPDTLKSCLDEMQKMLNDLNKALQDFENAVKGFRCITCKIPPHISEEIEEIQQKINDMMKAYGDTIDKVENRLKQARKIYNRKDVYPVSGHEWIANSSKWSEQIDRVLK